MPRTSTPPRPSWNDAIENGTITRPADYTGFVELANPAGDALATAIAANDQIWLSTPGTYVINNPITINRTTKLYIHGISMQSVLLKPTNITQPMFIVEKAPLIQCHGFTLGAVTTNATAEPDGYAFDYRNADADVARLELIGMRVAHWGCLRARGPGNFLVCRVDTMSYYVKLSLRSVIHVDHDHARLWLLDTTVRQTSTDLDGHTDLDRNAMVYVERGLLRSRGTLLLGASGNAFMRVDSAAPARYGPHAVIASRFETVAAVAVDAGAKGTLIYTPPTASKVDLVLMSNTPATLSSLGGGDAGRAKNRLVNYNGNGDLWLIGNNCDQQTGKLVIGTLGAAARLIAIGNHTYNGFDESGAPPHAQVLSDAYDVTGGTILECATLSHYNLETGDTTSPNKRFVSNSRMSDIQGSLPPIPDLDWKPVTPLPLFPRLTAALPGMVNVKTAHGAVGDGVTDDRAALQAAINATAARGLFFPEGTYLITSGPLLMGWGDWDHSRTTTSTQTITGGNTIQVADSSIFWNYLDNISIPKDGGGVHNAQVTSIDTPTHTITFGGPAFSGVHTAGGTISHVKWTGDDPFHSAYNGGVPHTLAADGASFWGMGADKSIIRTNSGALILNSSKGGNFHRMGFRGPDYGFTGDDDPTDKHLFETTFSPSAPQHHTWWDCEFRGGRICLAFGYVIDGNNDFMAAIRCKFSKARYAVGDGFFNAIDNEIIECRIEDCENVIRAFDRGLVIDTELFNVTNQIRFYGSGGNFYCYRVNVRQGSTRPYHLQVGVTHVPHIALYDQCNFDCPTPKTSHYDGTTGPIFLRCKGDGLTVNLNNNPWGARWRISLLSQMDGFSGTIGANDREEVLS